jgi:hypothetical protein
VDLPMWRDFGVFPMWPPYLVHRTPHREDLVHSVASSEFGEHEGQNLIVDKGLYGLWSSSARFHEHLAAKLRLMACVPSKADSNPWMKGQRNTL